MDAPQRTRGRSVGALSVATQAAALGWHLTAASARLGLALAWRTFVRPTELKAAVFARRLAVLFRALGPTYVKLGQILATRQDLLGGEVVRQLEPLQDRLAPAPFAAVAERLDTLLEPV
jgi:predicted unusual protein kinase regulating ubiquinone biosynthesis (AarF/ABC1/UbiB family)